MLNPPTGCAFHPRCKYAKFESGCTELMPELELTGRGHPVACFRAAELAAAGESATR